MGSGRVVRFLNFSIAIFLVLLLGAIYWYAWRPLPQTAGTLKLPVRQSATVDRDAIGVPHIRAANLDDLYFLQGYVTAQDRLWQMDGLRRLAAGELAEVIGPTLVETDRNSRLLRLRRAAEEHARTLPEDDRKVIAAYAAGVNHYIETHRDRLPLEFTLLDYEPRPWTIRDTILCGLQMYRDLTTSWPDDILKYRMRLNGDPAKVDALFPPRSGREAQPGSNAWAIAGKLTASGKPILANDPHLQFTLPSTWYQVHLQAPGLNVIGVTLPGVPAIIIGHNDRIAWGVTNLHFDVQDLYLEKLDLSTGRYLYNGQPEQARPERETIAVKGTKPVDVQQWVTRHGPVVVTEGNAHFALRWTATESGAFQFPFAELNRAKNWEEFRKALSRFPGPGQNFVFADTEGNIGYQATGLLPVRKGFAGDLPADGSLPENDWQGYIPFEELPRAFNPPSGMIVTANQNPFPQGYPNTVNGSFAAHYRSQQIRDLLSSKKGWKPEEMLAVQKDVYSDFLRFVAQQTAAAVERKKVAGEVEREATAALKNWDGQAERSKAAPLLATLIFRSLREEIARAASPKLAAEYTIEMSHAVVERLLRERPKTWFADWDEVLVKAFRAGLDEGRQQQGSSVDNWNYGQFLTITIQHPVGSQLPLVGSYFNIGPVSMSGSSTSVKQTTRRLGPSMRMVVDLANLDGSLNNLTIGQSGHRLSSHYNDQWDAYYVGRSFPMQFNKVDAKSTLRIEPK
jgi:penicillin amidase